MRFLIAFLFAVAVGCTFDTVVGQCNDCTAEVQVPCFVTTVDGVDVTLCPKDAGKE